MAGLKKPLQRVEPNEQAEEDEEDPETEGIDELKTLESEGGS